MEKGRNPYEYFKAAFEYEMNHNWHKKQKILAGLCDVSIPLISQILHGKKNAGIETIGKIATAMGYTFEEFFSFGRSIIEKNENISEPKPNKNGILLRFPVELKPPPSKSLIDMHKNLDAIFESGDKGLISAIESNLKQFQEIAELKKTVKEQKETIDGQSKELKTVSERLSVLESNGR